MAYISSIEILALARAQAAERSIAAGAFLQGGNSFGVPAVLGTNDANPLLIRTNGVTRAEADTSGNFLANSFDTLTVTGLVIGGTNANAVTIGGAANPSLTMTVGAVTLTSNGAGTLGFAGNVNINTSAGNLNFGASSTVPINIGSAGGNTVTLLGTAMQITGTTSVTLRGTTTFNDANNNTWLTNTAVGSAVNFVTIANAATGGSPTIQAVGTDATIALSLKGKGTAGVFLIDGNGNALLKTVAIASAVNFITIDNAATAGTPLFTSSGSDAAVNLKISTKGTGTIFASPGTDSTAAFVVANAALTNEFAIFDSTNARFSIASGGSVTPRTTLDVDGTAGVQLGGTGQNFIAIFQNTANNSTAGCATFWGGDDSATSRIIIDFREAAASGTVVGSIAITTSATAFNTSSDRRLKKDIEDTSHGLTDILKMRVRDFGFKVDEPGVAKRTGFIAQELIEVVPSAVTVEADRRGLMQVDYSKLTPYCVRAIQELHARIAQLESRAA
jgi:hypothetical protein